MYSEDIITRAEPRMGFQILEKGHGAFDPETGSQLIIKSTPEIEFRDAIYTSLEMNLTLPIIIRCKIPDRAIPKGGDPTNPCVMISAPAFNRFLISSKRYDFKENTRLIEHVIRMIAFVNKRFPQSTSPYLWSDYDDYASGSLRHRLTEEFLYQMPSDDELLRISLQPE